jgi:hypothetical protein
MAMVFDRAKDGALWYPGGLAYRSNLKASLFHKGKYEGTMDLGSGLVTNVGANAIANEAALWSGAGLASPAAGPIHTLKLANWHATGTGVTAAAVLDFKLQTWDSVAAVAGAQTWINTMAVPKYQTVATIAYAGSEAVTEWGLHTSGTLSGSTGTPFTATTATTANVTGTPLTPSGVNAQGMQQNLLIPGTTASIAHIATNTNAQFVLVNNGTTGWFSQAAMTNGTTPGGTEAFTTRPIFWDHKVFAAINVVSGDSIQFTYQLTVSSGG